MHLKVKLSVEEAMLDQGDRAVVRDAGQQPLERIDRVARRPGAERPIEAASMTAQRFIAELHEGVRLESFNLRQAAIEELELRRGGVPGMGFEGGCGGAKLSRFRDDRLVIKDPIDGSEDAAVKARCHPRHDTQHVASARVDREKPGEDGVSLNVRDGRAPGVGPPFRHILWRVLPRRTLWLG